MQVVISQCSCCGEAVLLFIIAYNRECGGSMTICCDCLENKIRPEIENGFPARIYAKMKERMEIMREKLKRDGVIIDE